MIITTNAGPSFDAILGDLLMHTHEVDVAAAEASGKLDTSIYAEASGAWQSAYTTMSANSAVWSEVSSGASYTGVAERTVGGITEGQTFTSASMTTMWDSLIKQEKFPTLVNPSSTFTSTVEGYREIGEVLASIVFAAAFNMGSITPQYTALSAYRSGLPNTYTYTGTGLSNQSKTTLTDTQTVTGYTVLVNGQSWQGNVQYDIGVQPKSSYDNDYSTPLAAGTTSYVTRTITGVYPYFATTVAISALTQQTLAAHNSAYVQTSMIAEDDVNKQTVDFPTVWSAITGIQFYNTINSTWEWINGSKVNSLTTFTSTATTHTVQGSTIDYNKFTHNGSKSGARLLRWYTT